VERRGAEAPASLPRRLGARERQQAAREDSSPPCAAPGQLLDGGEAATAADCYGGSVLTVKIRQPSHEFTFGVGISFIPYPLVLTPVV
jgi:hypothetical protein